MPPVPVPTACFGVLLLLFQGEPARDKPLVVVVSAGGGAADRLQIGTIQTDFKIFGRQKWPTIQIAYKNGTIHITYTSPLYKLTTVPHGQGVYCNHSEYAPHFKKYPEHSPTNNNYFFAFIIEM